MQPPAPRHDQPVSRLSFSNWVGALPRPAEQPAPSTSTIDAAAEILRDIDSSIVCDGSLSDAGKMGCAFVNQHHRLSSTRFHCKSIDPASSNSSFLAETLALEAALLDARAAKSKTLHVTTDCKPLRQLALGRDQARGPDKNGPTLSSAIERVIDLIRSFDAVFLSHIRSHNDILKENCIADLLAGLASNSGLCIDTTVTAANTASVLSTLNAHKLPRNTKRPSVLPVLVAGCSTCSACKCPSHSSASCFLSNAESFPVRSIFCRIQPSRPPTFGEQIFDPGGIDWSTAPSSVNHDLFTRFFTVCTNNLRRETHAAASLHAMKMWAQTYRYIDGHISRVKPPKPRDCTPFPHPDSPAHLEKLARDAKTAARLAREFHFHDAMKMLDRQAPVSPQSPIAIEQLKLLYPDLVTPVNVPPHAPNPGRCRLDRHIIHRYVKSRSSTSSPGISGFGFSWIQLFARLTVALETEDNPDPNWTIFVAFIEDLTCGSLPWLRHWATDLKGALFNKNPDHTVVKLRNLGIAEAFVRIAAYMVMHEALPAARALGLISTFDLGVAVPGGCETFVKIAQTAAEQGCTVISCDLEKAFNNVLKQDLWETVQFINCPLLTSWFCFFFHTTPRVHFAADPSAPFDINNSIQYDLKEGVAQGDPLSSFLFVTALSYILRGHRSRFPDAIRATVIDDICFVVPPEHSHRVPGLLIDLEDTLKRHNLTLNQAKTTVYCKNDFGFAHPSSFPYSLSHDGFSVCRVSVGSDAFCSGDVAAYNRKIAVGEASFERLFRALHLCKTRGRGLIFVDLLRLCFRSRFAWAMRTLPPLPACRVATAADDALSRLLDLAFPAHPLPPLPQEWQHLRRIHQIKLALPLVKGGLGLRTWTSLLNVTHFSSWVEAGPRILALIAHVGIPLPPIITADIGTSVAALSARFDAPDHYWFMDAEKRRRKCQHELTEWMDNAELSEGASLSHDPAVTAQFLGSSTATMSMPFNCSLVPRHILDTLDDNHSFSYALAWHTMRPLFPIFQCPCNKTWDPLGLHAASCIKLNAYNLLHNSVRDCFTGAARFLVRDHADSNVGFILSDANAKSSTWIHEYYPKKSTAPAIIDRTSSTRCTLPSLSPDILISFLNDPLHPYFGDFVACSPSVENNLSHGHAAQAAHNQKLQHYHKHHEFPAHVFYPLAFERSGYLHPVFVDFIDLFAMSAIPTPSPRSLKLQLFFSIAFAITFTTASLLKAASHLLTPRAALALLPPRRMPMPTRWAPQLPLPCIRPRLATRPISQTGHTAPDTNELHGTTDPTCAAPSCHGSRGPPMLPLNTAAARSEGPQLGAART